MLLMNVPACGAGPCTAVAASWPGAVCSSDTPKALLPLFLHYALRPNKEGAVPPAPPGTASALWVRRGRQSLWSERCTASGTLESAGACVCAPTPLCVPGRVHACVMLKRAHVCVCASEGAGATSSGGRLELATARKVQKRQVLLAAATLQRSACVRWCSHTACLPPACSYKERAPIQQRYVADYTGGAGCPGQDSRGMGGMQAGMDWGLGEEDLLGRQWTEAVRCVKEDACMLKPALPAVLSPRLRLHCPRHAWACSRHWSSSRDA